MFGIQSSSGSFQVIVVIFIFFPFFLFAYAKHTAVVYFTLWYQLNLASIRRQQINSCKTSSSKEEERSLRLFPAAEHGFFFSEFVTPSHHSHEEYVYIYFFLNIFIESMYLCRLQILSSYVNAALRDYWKSSALFMFHRLQQTCYSVAQVNHKLACIHMALT